MNKTSDCSFLDLFAGSGQVGIEALSRGAKQATFVESSRPAVKIIKENLKNCWFIGRVWEMDAVKSIKILAESGDKYDIIFIGAPYDSPDLKKVLELLGEHKQLLNPGGVVIAEHRKQDQIAKAYAGLKMLRSEKYGETELSFYECSSVSG